jgi:hypothetical protein
VSIYNGPSYDWDEAYSIVVDGDGNVYVTGRSKRIANVTGDELFDYCTIKYNSSGVQQWVAGYDGTGNGNDESYAISVDSESNVYVTGRSKGDDTSFDFATIKYNSSGTQQWIMRYDGYQNADEAYSISLDYLGNVFVTGGSFGSGTKFDYLTIKYSQNNDLKLLKPVSH